MFQFIVSIVFLGATFAAATSAHADIKFSGPVEFGILPTTPQKVKNGLPLCSSLPATQIAMPQNCVKYYNPDAKKNGIYISEDWVQNDYLVRILRRNPLLVGLADFFEFCRPRGGILSPDGLSCQYTIWF